MKSTSKVYLAVLIVAAALAGGLAVNWRSADAAVQPSGAQAQSGNQMDAAAIRAYVATLTGNSISDCLELQLGHRDYADGKPRLKGPCQIRKPERRQSVRIYKGENGQLPVPYVLHGDLPRQERQKLKTLTIYIIGGPLAHPEENLADHAIISIFPKDSTWVFPIYKGSGFRASLDGGADFRLAVREISALSKMLRTEYPNARIDVIADSYGTFLASRIDHTLYDRQILVSPPLQLAGRDLEPFFRQRTSQSKMDFDFSNVPIDNSWRDVPIKGFPYIIAVGHEIGAEALVLQSGIRTDCSLLIYGKNDHFFSPEWLRGQRLFDRFTQVVALDTGHDVLSDPDNKARTQQAIREFECPRSVRANPHE